MPEYEIAKPVSRKTVYDALPKGCPDALAKYCVFEEEFRRYGYRFTDPIDKNDLFPWLENHTVEKHFLREQGFLKEKRPAFAPVYLPIETEEEFTELKELIVTASWTNPRRRILERLNAIYSPIRSECGEGG